MDERKLKVIERIKKRLAETVEALERYSTDVETAKLAREDLNVFCNLVYMADKKRYTTFAEVADKIKPLITSNLSSDEQSVLLGYINALSDYGINIVEDGV